MMAGRISIVRFSTFVVLFFTCILRVAAQDEVFYSKEDIGWYKEKKRAAIENAARLQDNSAMVRVKASTAVSADIVDLMFRAEDPACEVMRKETLALIQGSVVPFYKNIQGATLRYTQADLIYLELWSKYEQLEVPLDGGFIEVEVNRSDMLELTMDPMAVCYLVEGFTILEISHVFLNAVRLEDSDLQASILLEASRNSSLNDDPIFVKNKKRWLE